MGLSSPKIEFDSRLLTIEELVRNRQFDGARRELAQLSEGMFGDRTPQDALQLSLQAEVDYFDGNYKRSLESGLKSARIFADYPLNKCYARVQLVISKCYAAIGDLKNAEMRARDALAAYRRGTYEIGQVDALNELARVAYMRFELATALDYLDQAYSKVVDNPRKLAQISSNQARIKVRTGQWPEAESQLKSSIEYDRKNGEELSLVINLLDLAQLQMRQRRFILSGKNLDAALEIISRLGAKREKLHYLEFAGELAFEKGDYSRAKSVLSSAYHDSLVLAPSSALVSQTARRLAEVELTLDNLDEAMKYGQKALELSQALGEKKEIALSYRVIAQVRAAHSDFDEARSAIDNSIGLLREVNDPYVLARTYLVQASIHQESPGGLASVIVEAFEQSSRLFDELGVKYWLAQTAYRHGVYACQRGDFPTGFSLLGSAQKNFDQLGEKTNVRLVKKYLAMLSEQAVALSISESNEFKILGKLLTPNEQDVVQAGQLEDLLSRLLDRTNGDRSILCRVGSDCEIEASTQTLDPEDHKAFTKGFGRLLGQEIAKDKPSLILDARRDPYFSALFPSDSRSIASVIVVPLGLMDGSRYCLYVDRFADNGNLCPFSQEELNFAVGFADLVAFKWAQIQKNRLLEDNMRLRRQLMEESAFPNVLTNNAGMAEVLGQMKQVVDANISISLEGETGTGKDLLARALHYNSIRREKRFISVNCAALPEPLLESELFGYKRGAFTGADRDKPGLFEEADGGTFFLDEIADMPLSIQAKILRVIEEKEIVRLGDTVPRKLDVRIVSATNKNLKEEMARGTFRQDLYYRLTALTFRLPSLRERREDIPLLIGHFLEGTGKTISDPALKALIEFDWPGNIRELQNEIKKLTLLSGDKKQIELEALSSKIGTQSAIAGNGKSQPTLSSEDIEFSGEYSLYDHLARHERRFILRALSETRGVKKHAAASLNIPESTLRLKIKQYGIQTNRPNA